MDPMEASALREASLFKVTKGVKDPTLQVQVAVAEVQVVVAAGGDQEL